MENELGLTGEVENNFTGNEQPPVAADYSPSNDSGSADNLNGSQDSPALVAGPRRITIAEYLARQRPRPCTPPPKPKKNRRSGRKLKLRRARAEACRMMYLEQDPVARKIYRDRFKTMKGLKKLPVQN